MSQLFAKPVTLIVLGPPASGKGTQARRLADQLGLPTLSTGAWLRQQVKVGSLLGNQAAPILARGEYLPDHLMEEMTEKWLSEQTAGWVLDGFPRSLPQAQFLDRWLLRNRQPLTAAISLTGSFEDFSKRIHDRFECPTCDWTGQRVELLESIKCPRCFAAAAQRADDHAENFSSRHAEFLRLTCPVIEHYRAAGLLKTVSALASQDSVAAAIRAALAEPSFLSQTR